jgi:hypothetical protein
MKTLITTVVGHHMTMINTMKNIGIINALVKHYGIKNVGPHIVTLMHMQTIGIINALVKQHGFHNQAGLVKKINAINDEQQDAETGAQQHADKDAQTGVQQDAINKYIYIYIVFEIN